MPAPAELARFFERQAPLAPGDGLLVALSGGPDSTALASLLAVHFRGSVVRLAAAHFDHAADPGSGERAAVAARAAAHLAMPIVIERHPAPPGAGRDSPEAGARRRRYDFLERTRKRLGARYVATAHHRDDQVETVLLRLLFGSGLEGLAAMAPRRGHLVRPCLELSRRTLARHLTATGLPWAADPTNADLAVPRNLLRHRILPRLAAADPRLGERVLGLAAAAAGLRHRLERELSGLLESRGASSGVALAPGALARLPRPLLPHLLAAASRAAGAAYPPRAAAVAELERQLDAGRRIGCDLGNGLRAAGRRDRVALARPTAAVPPFAYTLTVPGEIWIPELSRMFRLRRGAVKPWMFRGEASRAGLALGLQEGETVTVRNRRPGDRIRPLGCRHRRRLKDVLIDRRLPRSERDRLPLLAVGGRLVWVPGVTIDDGARLGGESRAWVAEIGAA